MQQYEATCFKAVNTTIQPISPSSELPRYVRSTIHTPAITGYFRLDSLIHSYEVVGKDDGLVALKCTLYTGKTHQIRIHLKDVLGIDIVNDKKYGKKRSAGKVPSFLDKKQMYLHCKSIQLCLDGRQLSVYVFGF